MRVRVKKNIEKRVDAVKCIMVSSPERHKGKWKDLFSNNNPIYLEIGSGKGQFVLESARKHPDINFIAIEREINVLIIPLERVLYENISNLKFLDLDASKLTNVFEDGEISRIYLNFSDPWPKSRQAKRRLTHRSFLGLYDIVLKKNGKVEFKTDNQSLFEFSIIEFVNSGWMLEDLTLDLHKTNKENITTEYEDRFTSRGDAIYKLIAFKKDLIIGSYKK